MTLQRVLYLSWVVFPSHVPVLYYPDVTEQVEVETRMEEYDRQQRNA